MSDRVVPLERRGPRPRRKCPICGRPSEASRAPFCSKRCADEDLARWLTGAYRIATQDSPGEGASDDEDGPPDGSR